MNHFLLPYNNKQDPYVEKYGDTSLKLMLKKMLSLNASKYLIEAKVFGGSNILHKSGSNFNIGKKNVEVALSLLEENNIKIVNHNMGGKTGRKIIFDTSTGIVNHRYIVNSRIT
jgi:chemotaxis protein CheD